MLNNDALVLEREYLPEKLEVSDWQVVESYFHELLSRKMLGFDDLKKWLRNRSELESFLQEELGWRYIRMSCDTANEEYSAAFNFFVGEIQPKIAPLSHQLDQFLLGNAFLSELKGRPYEILLRQVKKRVEIFREANVLLFAELQQKEQEFSAISGAMSIEWEGQEITLQQANNFLEQDDRNKREQVYQKIMARRAMDANRLDDLMNELLVSRNEIAANADFKDFRDFMFASLGRFDYTANDCIQFHEAVEKFLVPINEKIDAHHRKELQLDVLKPWDVSAAVKGKVPLQPFSSTEDAMTKTIACFHEIDPFLGSCMSQMKQANRIDLDSRKGKAPGGYNYPLYETGLPFIFMNSTNSLRDMVTLVHEGGHAVQSIVDRPLELVDFKNLPSEIAELASMSMELISMEHWHHFFENKQELKMAKRKHLEDVLKGLPWIACVDAFQHWIYTNPNHTVEERSNAWLKTYERFASKSVDWSGVESVKKLLWQKQLHIYEVPFYYIEYGFAQLGAIAMWRNYRLNPEQTIKQYLDALKMGYTASISEVYEKAGVRFDFSEDYIRELAGFVNEEWEKLID
ncbi:MAG: M3 family oligoendopeptidase [Bacteroidetes bacterium]|nr:M3 family oligoendopeptidase [Bacteroidota bacterium]